MWAACQNVQSSGPSSLTMLNVEFVTLLNNVPAFRPCSQGAGCRSICYSQPLLNMLRTPLIHYVSYERLADA